MECAAKAVQIRFQLDPARPWLRSVVRTARVVLDRKPLRDATFGPDGTAAVEISPADAASAKRHRLMLKLDRDLVQALQQRFCDNPRFALSEGDVLALPLPPATAVVANIPYNITGPLLERLVGRLDRPVQEPYRRLVLLVQQEVGERIRARPGSSAYSALSVRMQLLASCRTVCPVPPRCFQPPPKVMSEVVCLDPLPPEQRLDPALARTVEALLRRCFAARRKMLRNTLAGLQPPEPLQRLTEAAGIRLDQRPQEVAPAAWVALAAGLNRLTA